MCSGGVVLCRGTTSAITRYDAGTAISDNDLIYIFGGRNNAASSGILSTASYAEQWDVTGLVVTSLSLNGYANVTARAGHNFVFWRPPSSPNGKILMFGGQAYAVSGTSTATLNDLQILDISTSTWATLSTNKNNGADLPSQRQYSSAAVATNSTGSYLLVFGGNTVGWEAGTSLNDVWSFDLTANVWSEVNAKDTGSKPSARLNAAALAIIGDFLLVYGGWYQSSTTAYNSPPPPNPSSAPGYGGNGAPAGGGGPASNTPVNLPPPYLPSPHPPPAAPPNPPPRYPPPPPPPPSPPGYGPGPGQGSTQPPPSPSPPVPSPPSPSPQAMSAPATGGGPTPGSAPGPATSGHRRRTLQQQPNNGLVTTWSLSLLSDLWALDLRSSPAVWYKVVLSPVSGQNSNMLAGGYDSKLTLNSSNGDLYITALGGYKYSSVTTESSYSQWLATYTVSNLTSVLYAGVAAEAASGTHIVHATFNRTSMYIGTTPVQAQQQQQPGGGSPSTAQSQTLVNSDGSAVDVATGVILSYPTTSASFVHQTSLTVTSTGNVLVNGGMYYMSSPSGPGTSASTTYTPSSISSSVLVDTSVLTAVDLDNSIQPSSSYFYSTANSVIIRTMAAVKVPIKGSLANAHTCLAFYGDYDTSEVAAPDLGYMQLSDSNTLTVNWTCQPGTPNSAGTCQTVQLNLSKPPPPRNYYSPSTIYATLPVALPNGSSYQVDVVMLWVYGGSASSGGKPPGRPAAGSASSDGGLDAALKKCDNTDALSSVSSTVLQTLSTCAWGAISSSSSSTPGSSGGSSGGGGGSSQGGGGGGQQGKRRSLLGGSLLSGSVYAEHDEEYLNVLEDLYLSEGMGGYETQTWDEALGSSFFQSSRTKSWLSDHGLSASSLRHLLASTANSTNSTNSTEYSAETTEYFYELFIGLLQTEDVVPLTNNAAGPALVWTQARNLVDGYDFSPGPRTGAAAAMVSKRETLIMGGLTLNPSASNVTGSVMLSNDIHYFRYFYGGESVNSSDFSLSSCYNNITSTTSSITEGSCKSVAPYVALPPYTLPATAPINTSAVFQASSVNSYCCSSGNQFLVTVQFSSDPNYASDQGFQIMNWLTGDIVFTSNTASGFSSQISSCSVGSQTEGGSPASGGSGGAGRHLHQQPGGGGGGGGGPSTSRVKWCSVLTLPNGLYQVILTSSNGQGWLSPSDSLQPWSQCCIPSSKTAAGTSCCPSLTITSQSCGGASVTGFTTADTTWDLTSQTQLNPQLYVPQLPLGLSVCSTTSIPSPTRIQYPFQQLGSYAHSFEVQPSAQSPLPVARHRHAIAFLNNSGLYQQFGSKGILIMYGGTTDQNVASAAMLLNDLWVFCFSNHTWIKIIPDTAPPPAMQGHSMTVQGTQVFVSAGEYYDNTTDTWQVDNYVYSIDLALTSNLAWRTLTGGSNIENSTSLNTAVSSSMEVLESTSQLALMTAVSLYLVPITTAASLSGSLSGSSNGTLSSFALISELQSLYDGDSLILNGVVQISVANNSTVVPRASIYLQGATFTSNSSSATSSGSRRRHVLSSQAFSLLQSTGNSSITATGVRFKDHSGEELNSENLIAMNGADIEHGRALLRPVRTSKSSHHDMVLRCTSSSGKTDAVDGAANDFWLPHAGDVRYDLAAGGSVLDTTRLQRKLQSLEIEKQWSGVNVRNADEDQTDANSSVDSVDIVEDILIRNAEESGRSPRRSLLYADVAAYTSISTMTIMDCKGSDSAMVVSASGTIVTNIWFRNCLGTALIINATTTASTPVRIVSCLFSGNTGTQGGALRVESGAYVVISSSVFVGNNAMYGGAVYVANGGYITTISSTTFDGNGYASAAVLGGAIYVAQGACLSLIDGCYFTGNGAGASLLLGGAMYLYACSCSPTIQATTMFNNTAGEGGGALAFSNFDSVYTITITTSTFLNNSVGTYSLYNATVGSSALGGALYTSTIFGVLSVSSSVFTGNFARRSGGAVSTLSTQIASCTNCTFTSNWVNITQGGAWDFEKEGVLSFSSCTFTNNSANYGGAFSGSQYLYLSISSSTFNNNTAYSSAGAVECVSCSALTISNSIFYGNSALSAGALSMSYVLSGSVTNSTFVTNKAQTQVSTMNCGRDLSGGGGAVCVAIQGAVVFNDCLFKSNLATNGGGIWVYRTCNPSTDATCGSVSLLAPTFLNNTARGGGGGGIYTYDSSEVTYTCPSSTANSSLGGLNMGCISWLGNNATYGPLVATSAVSLSIVTPASGNVSDYNSDSSLPVLIAVKDAFNQTITGGSMESSASFSCTGVTTAPSGITVVSSSAGLASYTGLALRATPGTYFLSFSVSGTYHTLQPVSIQVNVRNCFVGEITTLQHDLCTYCAGDTYSFDPANISCDKCDTSLETCDFNKSATNTIGSILVPLNGNWHSSPWSPQVQSCPLADACSYDARQSDILAFQDALYYGTITVFSNGTLVNATAAAVYQELQCAPGYQGILCSDCQPTYGRTGANQCSLCPNITLNNIYYILSSLITVIMVSITIRGQLLSRGAEDEEEKDQEDEEVQEKRDKEADMEMDADLAIQQAQQDLSEIAPMLRTEGGDAPDKRVPLGEGAEDIQLEVSPRSKDAELQEKYVEDYTPDYHPDQVEDPVSKTRVSKGVKFSGAAEGANEEEDGEDNYLEVLDRKRKMAEPEDEDKALEMNDSKISAETPAIVMKILVSYLQVASIIHFMAIKWPSAVTSVLSVSDQVSNGASTLVSLDCSLTDTHIPKSVQRSIISVCLPIVLLLLSVPTWLLIYAYGKHKQQIEEALHPWLRYRMTVTLLSIIFFSYPGVTNTLLSFFNCPTVDDASAGLPYVDYLLAPGRYWASDYNLQCFTGYHNLLALYIGIPGVISFSLGVPAFSAYFLYKNKHRLREKGFIRSYGFIYGDYRDECFYWESVVMLRKLLIILVVVFLVTYGNVMQVVVALGIIIVAMVVQMIMDPYRLERMEFLERISLYGNTLLLYLSLLYTQSTFTGTSQIILGLALVVVNVLVVAFLLFHYAREWLRGKISKLDRTNGGFVSEEDIVRAASKAKSMTALVAAKSMHSFYKWAKANPHREKLAAAIVPYGMFGAKPGENPDEVLNSGWSKSFTGMGARRGVMGRNASENNVGGGGGGSALSRSVVNMNLHGSRPGISASSPSAVIASQSSAEQSQVGTIMSKPSMRSVAMVSISDKQQLDEEGAKGVSSGFGLKSEIAAALPSQDLIAFSPREGPRLGNDKAEQSMRGDHHSGVDDRLQLQGKSSLQLATASSLEVAGDHSVWDRALKTSHSSGPSGMSQSSAIGAAPLSNILRSSRVAPLPSSPHLPHFPQNS